MGSSCGYLGCIRKLRSERRPVYRAVELIIAR